MKKNRIEFVDLAKGFCICLVVFSHCCSHYHLKTPIDLTCGAFRMPLYFFLSGLFFKTYEGFDGFLKRKINKLVIPFLFFYLIGSVLLPNISLSDVTSRISSLIWKARPMCEASFLKSFAVLSEADSSLLIFFER